MQVSTDQPSYPSGVSASFTLTVTNNSAIACTRDLGAAQEEFVLLAGDARVWGSNDCIPGVGADVVTLAPQQSEQLPVAWSGSSSDVGCASARAPLPAGDYTLRGRTGTATAPDVVVPIT